MAGRYTVSESLDYILDHRTVEEERGQETGSEAGIEREVSEAEDDTEYNPDQERTDCGDDEDGRAEATVTFKSHNGDLFSSPPENQGTLSA